MHSSLAWIGSALANYLSASHHTHGAGLPTPPGDLLACLQQGDVLLVEGASRVSVAVKYLTQSTWSHAALYVGPNDRFAQPGDCFVEADLVEGVRSVGIGAYAGCCTRICRPVGLSMAERQAIASFVIAKLGVKYDLAHIIDLIRYLLPTPPVPVGWRRRLIGLGSGDPTRAICSTLIAEAFQSINYPILPNIDLRSAATLECPGCVDEILSLRHYSLFTPRDFDVSPYFQIVKPGLEERFDYRMVAWAGPSAD